MRAPFFLPSSFLPTSFILLCIILSISFCLPIAHALTPTEAGSMEAKVLITNSVGFEREGPAYRVDTATGTLTWFPRDTWLQDVESLTTEPAATRTSENIIFRWSKPLEREGITVTSTITTKGAVVPVRERIAFPLNDVPQELSPYLAPGEITDMTPEIQALAQTLAAGKTDAYVVVYSFADWTTRNVEYSLASAGQPAIQKSSQVLASKYGKCDELTALFISLNRAVGIPARFVAGYSYTSDARFDKPWGGHGWAEVWLPGQGWVPFDVTYGEYGYLDPSHVTLTTAQDAKEVSIDYAAQGRDFGLETTALDITVTPTKLLPRTYDEITIDLDAPVNVVGFGSSVLLLATITNERDYYVSTRVDLARTESTALSKDYENVLLKPYEKKTVPFLVTIDENLARGYEYTFPFTAYTRLGSKATTDVRVTQYAQVNDASVFAAYLTPPPAGSSLGVTCGSAVTYVGKAVAHACRANTTVSVCDPSCRSVTGEFTITTTPAAAGVRTTTYTASKGKEKTTFFVTTRAVSPTDMRIDVQAPATLRPDGIIEVIVNLSALGAQARDVSVRLDARHSTANSSIDALVRPAQFSYVLPGKVLRPGRNDLVVTVEWTDELGTKGSTTTMANVELIDVTVLDRIGFFLEDAGYWLGDALGLA